MGVYLFRLLYLDVLRFCFDLVMLFLFYKIFVCLLLRVLMIFGIDWLCGVGVGFFGIVV